MNASQARKRIREISIERQTHEDALVRTRGALVAGSLVSRFTKCKRPGCKCGKGEPHGPFLYLSRNEGGRTRWIYIGKAGEGRLAKAARRYKQFAGHVRALKRLAREAEKCYAALEAALKKNPDDLKTRRV